VTRPLAKRIIPKAIGPAFEFLLTRDILNKNLAFRNRSFFALFPVKQSFQKNPVTKSAVICFLQLARLNQERRS
jgi:hypothetical protein